MATTTLMPLPKQQYLSALGTPLIGGKVYTYAAGSTTNKATYTDAAGTTPQPNPIPLNLRGEPDNPIYWSGNYRVDVRDALGNLIYSVDNYNTDPGGLLNILTNLAANAGAALIGFIQAGAGAIKRTLLDKGRESISVLDYGADPTGANDSTAAINAAIASIPAAGGRVEIPQGGVFKISGPILGKTNVVLEGCGAGRDTLWTRVTLLATNAAAVLDFRDCDHYTIKGVRFDGATLSANALLQGYKTGSVHVAHAHVQDFCAQRVTGTAIDTGSGNPAGATNDCTYKDVIIETAGIGYDWYSTNNLVFGGVVAGCTGGGSRHNTSSEVKFYGTVFSGNKADHVLAGNDFVNGFSCFGAWYETSTDGIVKRYTVPSIANYVGKMNFHGCNLATSAAALMDLTNCQARVVIDGRRDSGSAINIVAPAGNSVVAINLLDDVTLTGGGILSKVSIDGVSSGLFYAYSGNIAGKALPGNATTAGAAIIGWNRSNGEGEMNLIGAKGGGGLGGVSIGDWDGANWRHLLWPQRSGTIFVANTTSVPVGNPVGGGYFYVEAGALKFKGSAGTSTTIAPA